MKHTNYARLLSMHWDVKLLLLTESAQFISEKLRHFDMKSFSYTCRASHYLQFDYAEDLLIYSRQGNKLKSNDHCDDMMLAPSN